MKKATITSVMAFAIVFSMIVIGSGANLQGDLTSSDAWTVAFDNLETVRFEKGKIVAGSPEAAWPVWLALTDENGHVSLSDFEAEVEIKLVDNLSDGTWAGMVFRQKEVGDKRETRMANAYLLAIRANGHTFLSRSGVSTLAGTTVKAPEKWYSWRQSIVLKVRAVANVITVWVDGQEIFSYTDENDDAFMNGYFVLIANTGQTEFSSIRITRL